MMRRAKTLLIVGLLLGLAGPAPAAPPPPILLTWKPGVAGLDQSLDKDPTGQPYHSGLVGWKGLDVQDDALAWQVRGALARNAAYQGVRFFWVFGECYGGGMFDDLNRLLGGFRLTRQYGVAASLYSEEASYPLKPPKGNGVDFVYSYLAALRFATFYPQAFVGAANDPFGTNRTPLPPRVKEVAGSEHPIYFQNPAIGPAPSPFDLTRQRFAILWSGQPNRVDRTQVARAFLALAARGYDPRRIYILYGSGRVDRTSDLGVAIKNLLPRGNLRAAESHILQKLWKDLFPVAAPVAPRRAPSSVYFLANDHGFNTKKLALEVKLGDGGLPAGEPVEPDPLGEGEYDGPFDPYF